MHCAVLLYLYAGSGIGLTVAQDIHLPVAEDFAHGGITIGRYVLHGGGGYELRLKGEVFGGGELGYLHHAGSYAGEALHGELDGGRRSDRGAALCCR